MACTTCLRYYRPCWSLESWSSREVQSSLWILQEIAGRLRRKWSITCVFIFFIDINNSFYYHFRNLGKD